MGAVRRSRGPRHPVRQSARPLGRDPHAGGTLTGPRRTLPQLGDDPSGPPPWLPLAWFACALAWLIASSWGLTRLAPALAAGDTQRPAIFALTHALTLGVVGSSIFGALHQFIPAVLGVGIRRPRVAVTGFWLTQAGTALLVTSLLRWWPAGQLAAWVVLFVAVGCTSWNVLPARRQAQRNRLVGAFVSLGHSALGVAMLVALARIGHGLGWWTVLREPLLAAHFHLGLVGFGTLTAAGIGSRMLPAFLQAPETEPGRALRAVAWGTSAGLVVLSIGLVWNQRTLTWTGGLLCLGAALVHFGILAGYFRRARLARPDPAAGFLLAATAWYLVTAGFGLGALVGRPAAGRYWAAYALSGVVGWLTLLILGVLHRIVPRLAGRSLAAGGTRLTPAQAGASVPFVSLSWAALALLVPGLALLVAGVATGREATAGLGAALVLGGAILLGVQAVALARRFSRS